MLAPYSDRRPLEATVDRLMVIADDVECDVALEFTQRECRMLAWIILSQLIRIAECSAGEQMKLAHLCANQTLDVTAEPGFSRRTPVDFDTGILATSLKGTAAEVPAAATVVETPAAAEVPAPAEAPAAEAPFDLDGPMRQAEYPEAQIP